LLYAVYFNTFAAAAFRRLEKNVQQRLQPLLDTLKGDARPPGTKLLHGDERIYRIRSGDFRILYQIDDDKHEVTIVDVGNRASIYRRRRGR
jgi:mRNA interferase RelE/StbE